MLHQSNHSTGTARASIRSSLLPGARTLLAILQSPISVGLDLAFETSKSKPLVVKASGRRGVWLLIHNMDVGSGICLNFPFILHATTTLPCHAALSCRDFCPISPLHLSDGGGNGSERACCLERKGRMEEDDVRRRRTHEPFWCLSKGNGTKTR
jgi:hypothetical protein